MSRDLYNRKDRLIQERRHDVYRKRDKWASPAHCPDCGVLYTNGRWAWPESSSAAEAVESLMCPACQRIADRYPAGYIKLNGLFFKQHRRQIINLIHNIETQEKSSHPLERIMAIKGNPDRTLITTTGIHLARRIGHALAKAYKGDLTIRYADAEQSVRVSWER